MVSNLRGSTYLETVVEDFPAFVKACRKLRYNRASTESTCSEQADSSAHVGLGLSVHVRFLSREAVWVANKDHSLDGFQRILAELFRSFENEGRALRISKNDKLLFRTGFQTSVDSVQKVCLSGAGVLGRAGRVLDWLAQTTSLIREDSSEQVVEHGRNTLRLGGAPGIE